jgi:hypothetical protein
MNAAGINNSTTRTVWSARLLAALFATLATLVFYKGYGRSDQIEQLPIILRAMDSDFLKMDFFTNVTEGAIARLYYSKLLALLYPLTGSLPLLFLLLTWVSNMAIALVSFGFARQLFGGDTRAGLFAAALAMAAYTFELGWIASGSMWMMTPTTIVLPFVLGAVWALIANRVVLAVALCAVASAIHPLLGLEVGGILLLVDVIRRLVLKAPFGGMQLALWGFCALLLGSAAYLLVYPQLTQEKIASSEFIYILAEFRHPHHYLPSSFAYLDYAAAAVFLIVAARAFRSWERRQADSGASVAVKWLVGTLLGLALLGYVLVEIIPLRLAVTAQFFRLLFLVKWAGLIFLAGEMARARFWSSVLPYAGAMHPFALWLGTWFSGWWSARERAVPAFVFYAVIALALGLLIVLTLSIQNLLPPIVLLALLGVVLYLYDFLSERLLRALSIAALLMAGVFFVGGGQVAVFGKTVAQPRMGIDIIPELPPAAVELAAFAKAWSPEEAIFLTPPSWGQFRILAQRAIVVDFKAFPFSDVSMKAWHQRLVDCYGESRGTGFHALPGLEANYRSIQDSKLGELRQRYGADFAVLYLETPSQYPVVFENSDYKMVALP